MKKTSIFFLSALILLLIACTCSPMSLLQKGGEDSDIVEEAEPPVTVYEPGQDLPQSDGEPYFSEIVFCKDVTDDGVPISPGVSFPSGTTEIWAYFTYEHMQDGMTWGRMWETESEIWVDGRGDSWEDGDNGWVAYGISEDDPSIPLNGRYWFSLYIGDEMVRQASFFVAEPQVQQTSSFPAFGAIQFAEGITEDIVPYGTATVFPEGTIEVYAVFPFVAMQNGQSFRREWIKDGEIYAERDMVWEEGESGIDYASLIEEDGLDPGVYTLNLYIDGQIARSANFEVLGSQAAAPGQAYSGPAAPEDIIDGYLMPAWENLYYSNNAVLSDLAQWALDNHIDIYVDMNYDGDAAYRHSCTEPPVIGAVIMSYAYWNDQSWDEVTAALAHELTHAVQHMSGNYRCECSIEKEYYAHVVEFYVLQERGRMDILENKYGGIYDEYTGKFSPNNLWEALRKTYTECPDY